MTISGDGDARTLESTEETRASSVSDHGAPDAAPKPAIPGATWTSRPASGAWSPNEIIDTLPWTRDVVYEDTIVRDVRTDSGWHLLGISHRGRVHAHHAAHREDALAVEFGAHGFVLAAADGAGSSRFSRVGSECVCREVTHAAQGLLREGLGRAPAAGARGEPLRVALVDALRSADRILREAASSGGVAARDFRTTALACLWIDGALATLQVGDGAIVVRTVDGSVSRLGSGDTGAYSGEVTTFLPEVEEIDLASRVVLRDGADISAIVLVTDGVEDPFYPFERRGAEVIDQLYNGVEAPAPGFQLQRLHGPVVFHAEAERRLREWIAFERRGENDDRTLVGAFRRTRTMIR